ncbi:hypothetical protein ACQJBY_054142 [Aegilops geniculata]
MATVPSGISLGSDDTEVTCVTVVHVVHCCFDVEAGREVLDLHHLGATSGKVHDPVRQNVVRYLKPPQGRTMCIGVSFLHFTVEAEPKGTAASVHNTAAEHHQQLPAGYQQVPRHLLLIIIKVTLFQNLSLLFPGVLD